MTLISYAQNFEDVMLWRALKGIDNGFYIDVGANDPVIDSVTQVFYEHGWHGINIEPLSEHHIALVNARPRDINLQCAVGVGIGDAELWETSVRGWATTSREVVSQHIKDGYCGFLQKVKMESLTSICKKYAPAEIHFLKIDVEGSEKSVIEGMDFSCFRPWIIVIEATRPNSTDETFAEWESEILDSKYLLAYKDGLNRFYVSEEHSELVKFFKYPPNIFDNFIRSGERNAEIALNQSRIEVQHLIKCLQEAETLLNSNLDHLDRMYTSWSWRISAPVRWIGYCWRLCRQNEVLIVLGKIYTYIPTGVFYIKKVAKYFLGRLYGMVHSSSKIKYIIRCILNFTKPKC